MEKDLEDTGMKAADGPITMGEKGPEKLNAQFNPAILKDKADKDWIEEEKMRIASRLMSARFDFGANVEVFTEPGETTINIKFPSEVTYIIEKDLEGAAEILKIVYDKEYHLVGIHMKGVMTLAYRSFKLT